MRLRNSRYGLFYGCQRFPACKATHGAHPDGKPLGVPADEETKQARIRAHDYFDRMWKRSRMARGHAYAWMQRAMGLTCDEAHIGRFTKEQCERLIALLEPELAKLRPREPLPTSFKSRDGRLEAEARVVENEHRACVGFDARAMEQEDE